MLKKIRSYGAGQAKLALLKHEEMSGQKPRFVTQTLETLANEDYFQEYVEIDLGHWCGKDLHRLAEALRKPSGIPSNTAVLIRWR